MTWMRCFGGELVAPEFPIVETWRDFVTDQARLARVRFLSVGVDFGDRTRADAYDTMRLDSGAPFSIIPYSVWQQRQLPWQPLGTEFYTPQGQLDQHALTWLGVPCFFGELRIRLVDEFIQRSRFLRLVAKLPTHAVASHLEHMALLGCNFLADNSLPMTLDPAHRTNAGIFTNVVGHITVL